MQKVDKMPTEGKFVATWEVDGELRTASLWRDGGELYVYDFEYEAYDYDLAQILTIPENAIFYIAG